MGIQIAVQDTPTMKMGSCSGDAGCHSQGSAAVEADCHVIVSRLQLARLGGRQNAPASRE